MITKPTIIESLERVENSTFGFDVLLLTIIGRNDLNSFAMRDHCNVHTNMTYVGKVMRHDSGHWIFLTSFIEGLKD